MKKNNKKGFILAETIAVSVIIMTSLVIVYTQFATLNNSYKTSFQYNNVNNLYLVNNLRNFIKDDGLDRLIQLLDNNEYVDITSCPSYLFDEYLYCRLLVDSSNMKTVLFTKEDISKLKNSIDNTNYSQTMKNYIKKINNSTGNSQRLIVEFEDETYATLLFVFNEEEDNFAMAPVSFEYTGGEQSFTVPHSGYYKLEVWGAQGGSSNVGRGGYGGYSIGSIYLTEKQILYINVGGSGKLCSYGSGTCSSSGGYNGGGYAFSSTQTNTGGGGATHIAIKSGLLKSLSESRDQILIVAGGGGGGGHNREEYVGNGGSGNGYIGQTGQDLHYGSGGYFGTGGSQTSGGRSYVDGSLKNTTNGIGLFGQGGQYSSAIDCCGNNGGGGGYYGGGSSTRGHGGAGGGSGYIGNSNLLNKSMYCYNCSTSTAESTLTYSTTYVSEAPISQYAKMGNGYAKITYVGETI